MYNKLALFEKDNHKVNLGSSFLFEKGPREMMLYLSNSLLRENVVKPLNEGRTLYFSDGSSSSKINDEKNYALLKHAETEYRILMRYHYNNQMTQTLLVYTWHCKIQ